MTVICFPISVSRVAGRADAPMDWSHGGSRGDPETSPRFGSIDHRAVCPTATTDQDLWTTITDIAQVDEDDVLVDIGCGDGKFIAHAARTCRCHCIGIDVRASCLDDTRRSARHWGVAHLVEAMDLDFVDLAALSHVLCRATVIYCFLLPHIIRQIEPALLKAAEDGARVVLFCSSGARGRWHCGLEMAKLAKPGNALGDLVPSAEARFGRLRCYGRRPLNGPAVATDTEARVATPTFKAVLPSACQPRPPSSGRPPSGRPRPPSGRPRPPSGRPRPPSGRRSASGRPQSPDEDADKLSLGACNLPRLEQALKEMRGGEASSSQAQVQSTATRDAKGDKRVKRVKQRLEAEANTSSVLFEREFEDEKKPLMDVLLEDEKEPLIDVFDEIEMGLIGRPRPPSGRPRPPSGKPRPPSGRSRPTSGRRPTSSSRPPSGMLRPLLVVPAATPPLARMVGTIGSSIAATRQPLVLTLPPTPSLHMALHSTALSKQPVASLVPVHSGVPARRTLRAKSRLVVGSEPQSRLVLRPQSVSPLLPPAPALPFVPALPFTPALPLPQPLPLPLPLAALALQHQKERLVPRLSATLQPSTAAAERQLFRQLSMDKRRISIERRRAARSRCASRGLAVYG